ncbi:MAG: CocE/NonD family hydrolase [Candidatus Promineifilaceae bacterium]|nr:CocE/NonD family hydrolase [Candidatus Promineifilaceae bacterium]
MNRRILTALLGLGAFGAAVYSRRRRLMRHALDLPPVNCGVEVRRGLRVTMSDGVALACDHYQPAAPGAHPTILIRTPYSRGGLTGTMTAWTAQRFAERGYHVIVQDVRGRFDSEGEFEPFVHEASDGRQTVDWILSQPWCNGVIGLWGQSYAGFAQWATVSQSPAGVRAIFPMLTRSNFNPFSENGIMLDTLLRWIVILHTLDSDRLPAWKKALRILWPPEQEKLLARGFDHLPLATIDQAVFGYPIELYRNWIRQFYPGSTYWQRADMSPMLTELETPVHLVGGWYDIFIADQLADYAALRQAGRRPYLTVGPWHHLHPETRGASVRLALDWFDFHLKDGKRPLRPTPVRIYLMGADQWRDLPDWPPPAKHWSYYLQPDGQLARQKPPTGADPDRYLYNPADPTPNVGGPLLSSDAGPTDNRNLEARPDVLTYTTEPLDQDVDVIGPVQLLLYVRSNRPHTSFFGRLCDVHPDGRSINICDGMARIGPNQEVHQPDGSRRLEIKLTPTAQRFLQGHRIRLQVSSGAHPRYARHLNTGELGTRAIDMVVAEQTVYHDANHPAALILPVAT